MEQKDPEAAISIIFGPSCISVPCQFILIKFLKLGKAIKNAASQKSADTGPAGSALKSAKWAWHLRSSIFTEIL
jgi:hypothetical protein